MLFVTALRCVCVRVFVCLRMGWVPFGARERQRFRSVVVQAKRAPAEGHFCVLFCVCLEKRAGEKMEEETCDVNFIENRI